MKNNTKYFKPLGPFDINFENLPGGKRITKDHVRNFWNSKKDLVKIGKGRGVYIFGMKVTAGVLPCYVGKTKKSFENECFTARNMVTYNGEILRYERNYKPFMFFLAYQPQKKTENKRFGYSRT